MDNLIDTNQPSYRTKIALEAHGRLEWRGRVAPFLDLPSERQIRPRKPVATALITASTPKMLHCLDEACIPDSFPRVKQTGTPTLNVPFTNRLM